MGSKKNKPILVFFQWNHAGLPMFLKLHMQLHVKCLSQFFDVILINHNCDYREICDKYQPDLALFESGYRTSISKKITIKNTNAYPEIPKLGLHNGDAWCECRTGFISDMAHWGIDTFFTIGTTTAEHTPEIAENLFVWPNFIDDTIYRDYGQYKIVPVLFNGYINPLYPWRQNIFKIVSRCYPSFIFPHLGYENHSPKMIHGEEYSRAINASWFVPTCGTLAKEVVRKHFEIPGSKSCLITEKSASLEAAGFIDMENCVFADEKNILDKIDHLFKNKNELEKIIENGYQLVHSHHTLKQRDQISQWFHLNSNLKSNQEIVQINPFGSLQIVDKSVNFKKPHLVCHGLDLELLRKGDEKLASGKYDDAEALYLSCLNYIHWMSEPKLKLAICSLYKGNAQKAGVYCSETLKNILRDYRAVDPDPVEWAYYIISLLCQGKLNRAIIRANQFPLLHHLELERIRWVINYIQGKEVTIPLVEETFKSRYSIHKLPQLNFLDWINNLSMMAKACKQKYLIKLLDELILPGKRLSENSRKNALKNAIKANVLELRIKYLEKVNYFFEALNIPNPRPELPAISEMDYVIRIARVMRINYFKRFLLKKISYLKNRSMLMIL